MLTYKRLIDHPITMLLTREDIEKREAAQLASYAIKANASQGRQYPEKQDFYRTCFQRDRDRIIHSKAFRRLKGKTQVFIARFGDHYRSRLTHSMEVAQLSRDMSRTLNLNEDLAETIALAHDLGHTPFGHSGQDTMHEIMQKYNSRFEHNEQSKRVVEFLEKKSSHYSGLNLSFEVKDGLIKHRTFYDQPIHESQLMSSLEAQIVNIADEIAYLNHDIEDGIRSEILKVEDLDSLELWKKAKKQTTTDSSDPFFISEMKSILISLMTQNLTQNTDQTIQSSRLVTVDEVYHQEKELSGFSEDFYKDCIELKNFLYKRFYHSEEVMKYNKQGQKIISTLFEKLNQNFELMPKQFCLDFEKEEKHILIKDYIAGMTDHFAMELYEKLRD